MFAPLARDEYTGPNNTTKTIPTKTPIIPVPADAPAFNFRHPKHGEPTGRWAYRQADGAVVAYIVRFDFEAEGKAGKEVMPVAFCLVENEKTNYRAWRSCGVPAPRPLYRLPHLAAFPHKPTIITEGEKKADRAVELFPDYEATTTMGGAKASHLSSFDSLAGRQVIVWPDNDDAGRAYASEVAQLALAAGATAAIVQVPQSFPPKWDLADPLPCGVTVNDLGLLLAEAEPVELNAAANEQTPSHTDRELREKGPPQRDKLLYTADRAEFWRCPDGIAYATVPVGNHREHHKVRDLGFRDWLIVEAGRAFRSEIAGRVRPGSFSKNAVEDALSACEAAATASGKVKMAPLRVGAMESTLYIDLGSPNWDAVEVTPEGWRIVSTPAVPILRTRRTRSLPQPKSNGFLAALRDFLPINGDDEWRLTVLWLLAALRPKGPYPILAFSGEQGTGKSFAARILRRLVDPCGDDIMQPPREDRDLIAAAKNNHVLAFDNLSKMSGELADSLCRLATGGDIGGRMFYTNDDTAAFAAQRPIIVNGIPDIVSRGDLASRAIFVRLTPMRRRRTEADLWKDFSVAGPNILGALLDALSAALRSLPLVSLPDDSTSLRMADFALLALAAEGGLGWPAGSALDALRRNMRSATVMMADLDPVAVTIRSMVERENGFTGLVSALHVRLNEIVDVETRRGPGWPKHPARLGEHLRRIAPALRANGIPIDERRTRNGMTVTIGVGVGGPASLSLNDKKEEDNTISSISCGEANSQDDEPASPTSFGDHVETTQSSGDWCGANDVRDTHIAQRARNVSGPATVAGDVGRDSTEDIIDCDLPPGAEAAI